MRWPTRADKHPKEAEKEEIDMRLNTSDDGVTLMELMVTIAVISIVFAIGVPIYLNQTGVAYESTAQTDASTVGRDVITAVTGYMSFGTNPGDIYLEAVTNKLTFSPMEAASPEAFETGPGVTSYVQKLSAGSALRSESSFAAGADMKWCVAVQNHGKVGVFTQDGLDRAAKGCNSQAGTPRYS